MLAEPFICTKGQRAGQIVWAPIDNDGTHLPSKDGELIEWRLYVDFEREKLRELSDKRWPQGSCVYITITSLGFALGNDNSSAMLGYHSDEYIVDSESNRLLKRAEFLKAVCKKENIQWLNKEKKVTLIKPK